MGELTARQQLDNLTDALVEDLMSLSDGELLAECIEDGEDPEQIATDMRKLVDRAVLFAPVEDVNGRPRPRWEEMLEDKVSAGLVGEALSLVRYLIEVSRDTAETRHTPRRTLAGGSTHGGNEADATG